MSPHFVPLANILEQQQIAELEPQRDLSQTIVHVDMDAFYAVGLTGQLGILCFNSGLIRMLNFSTILNSKGSHLA
jgi:hypothetical protein